MSLLNDSHKELIDAAKNGSLVIFAGAGISKSVGLPLWGELIEKIIQNINNNNLDEGEILKTLYEKSSPESKIFKVLVLLGILWKHVQIAMKKQYCYSKVCSFSITSSN